MGIVSAACDICGIVNNSVTNVKEYRDDADWFNCDKCLYHSEKAQILNDIHILETTKQAAILELDSEIRNKKDKLQRIIENQWEFLENNPKPETTETKND